MKFAIFAVVMLAVAFEAHSSLLHGLGAGPLLTQGPIAIGWGASIPAAAISIDASGLAGHSATYVAKTRGALHTAPLPGHTQSAASLNLNPAPGTW